MVISYNIWKYLLGVGVALVLLGLWRLMAADSESGEASAIMLLLFGGPLVMTGLLLAAIARSRKS